MNLLYITKQKVSARLIITNERGSDANTSRTFFFSCFVFVSVSTLYVRVENVEVVARILSSISTRPFLSYRLIIIFTNTYMSDYNH